MARRLRALLVGESGITIVEMTMCAALLVGVVVATVGVLDSSREAVTSAERQEVAVHRGEQELERLRAIPFARLELTSAPATSADPADPRFYVRPGPAYDFNGAAAGGEESLVVTPSGTTNPDAVATRRPWSDGRLSGTLDVFVTAAAADGKLKRAIVTVTVTGDHAPRRPVVLSTLVSQQAGAR